jgi:uncharacterized protein YyaL (SSP411 family)
MATRRTGTHKTASQNGGKDIPTIDVEVVDTSHDSANAELIAKIDELKAALEKSQQKEKTLMQTVDSLQDQLDEQKATIHSLQAVVEKANQIHHELEQAQQTALRLAESNQSLIEENKALRHENQASKSTESSSELALSAPNDEKPNADLRRHQEILRQRQAARLSHPVFPNPPEPTQFENQDIGWVD